MGMAGIIMATFFQEYNMYFRVIRHHPGGPDRKCSRGQALFVVGFPGVCTMGMVNIIVETYFQEYNTDFGTIR